MRCGLLACVAFAAAATAAAQAPPRLVVDEIGLPIPGVHLTLIRDQQPVDTVTSGADGTFAFRVIHPDDLIEAAADGFDAARVPAAGPSPIVMRVASTVISTTVTASPIPAAGATSPQLGAAMTAASAAALPSAHKAIVESLPLLPSVMRGADGLLRIDGTRPHESTLWIDGFDVTDPVTGASSIDLPFEAVKSVTVLRDPMAATYGGTLGTAASIETAAGADRWTAGVEEFVPEPRLSRSGFGQIEGFYPRLYAGGRSGPIRLFAAYEFDFERIVVPGVTTRDGRPTTASQANTTFARIDIAVSPRHTVTVEALDAPGRLTHAGLSPIRDAAAAPSIHRAEALVGVVDRLIVGTRNLVTLRVAATRHRASARSSGDMPARLTPEGWRDNSAGSIERRAARQSVAVSWDRTGLAAAGRHDVTFAGEWTGRAMDGAVQQQPLRIEDAGGRMLRLIEFSSTARFHRCDATADALVSDAWRMSNRTQRDVGARIDWYRARAVVSPRLGARIALDSSQATVLKAGIGRFVGRLPLGALAFDALPARRDMSFDASTRMMSMNAGAPAIGRIDAPRADAITIELDRHVNPGLDLQFEARRRTGSRLATIDVTQADGATTLASSGSSTYREVAVAVRQRWRESGQVFVSYVWSANRAELNDFGAQAGNLIAPHFEPGARARSADDVPHRLVAWGTVPLARRIVIAPALEWRSGFPFAPVDAYRHYEGVPNSGRFPAFVSVDLFAYRTVEIRHHLVDLGAQLFNLTRHFNPRDVLPVTGTSAARRFTNSVGMTIDGYLNVKWD